MIRLTGRAGSAVSRGINWLEPSSDCPYGELGALLLPLFCRPDQPRGPTLLPGPEESASPEPQAEAQPVNMLVRPCTIWPLVPQPQLPASPFNFFFPF